MAPRLPLLPRRSREADELHALAAQARKGSISPFALPDSSPLARQATPPATVGLAQRIAPTLNAAAEASRKRISNMSERSLVHMASISPVPTPTHVETPRSCSISRSISQVQVPCVALSAQAGARPGRNAPLTPARRSRRRSDSAQADAITYATLRAATGFSPAHTGHAVITQQTRTPPAPRKQQRVQRGVDATAPTHRSAAASGTQRCLEEQLRTLLGPDADVGGEAVDAIDANVDNLAVVNTNADVARSTELLPLRRLGSADAAARAEEWAGEAQPGDAGYVARTVALDEERNADDLDDSDDEEHDADEAMQHVKDEPVQAAPAEPVATVGRGSGVRGATKRTSGTDWGGKGSRCTSRFRGVTIKCAPADVTLNMIAAAVPL